VIHTRAADDDTRDRLLAHDGPVVLHCFSSPGLLEPALERGWYVSLAGNVTYKNAYDLRAAARRIPHDKLLAETDSPYLAPQAVRGKRNEPAYVVHTYDVLAELHGEEIRKQIVANAEAVFHL
jgi:TatD DNase family protein